MSHKKAPYNKLTLVNVLKRVEVWGYIWVQKYFEEKRLKRYFVNKVKDFDLLWLEYLFSFMEPYCVFFKKGV